MVLAAWRRCNVRLLLSRRKAVRLVTQNLYKILPRLPVSPEAIAMSDTITLICLLRGQSFDRAFPVGITKSELVGDLRELINTKTHPTLNLFAAHELTLWGVSILAEDDATLRNLVLANTTGIQKLAPSKKIGSILSKEPAEEHIHVIVERPW